MKGLMWHVYIVQCRDNTLYTGITNDIARRIEQHNSGKGSKFTSYRRPVTLVYSEKRPDKSKALKREIEIKKLSRSQKLSLIKTKVNN